MGTLIQDLRFAVRSLRKAPAFPLAAIATLALGIGATTAIFSTLNAVLLKPLAYPHPEDLYGVRTALTDGRVTTGLLSGAEIFRLNAPNLSIERAAGLQAFDATLLVNEEPRHIRINGVTQGFFELFGLPMTLGGFTPDQFVVNAPPPPGAAPQQGPLPPIVISQRVWRELYSSDPNVVGKPIRFAEFPAVVAGVAPKDFDTPHDGDYWTAQALPQNDPNHGQEGFMRLKHGQTIERANSEMSVVIAGLAKDFPNADLNRVYETKSLVSTIVGDLGPILIIVMSATGLLLLLACVNVTNLMLARGAARAREMAVRVALGASRGRIVRQLLTESVLLASIGAALGVLVAWLGVRALLTLGASRLPRLDSVTFDSSVLIFTVIVLAASGLLVGFAPALRLARTDVRTLMNESSRSASGGRSTARWLSVMTVAEIAVAIVLVAAAGWLVRGFATLRSVDPGFVAAQRVIFDVTLPGQKYRTPDAVRTATGDLLEHVRALHGVTAVGATSSFPLRGTLESNLILQFHGEAVDPQHPSTTRQRFASPTVFESMGTKAVQGRVFNADDRPDTQRVAVVNKTFVNRYMAGKEPIGTQFSAGYPAPNPQFEVTIVGVVDDVRQKTLGEVAEPAFYTPTTQPFLGQQAVRRFTVVVATSLDDPTSIEPAIREVMKQQDSQIAIDFEQVPELVAGTIRRQQLGMTLMLIFGGVAVLLAAVGIYGVVAYAVSQRKDEMATRLALGAAPGAVFWLVMKQGGILALIGTGLGLVIAYLSGKLVSSQLYAVSASDPVMLTTAILVVAGIAVIATTIPAWRASRLNPANALHPE
jgi:putative ABC transport system permease protein